MFHQYPDSYNTMRVRILVENSVRIRNKLLKLFEFKINFHLSNKIWGHLPFCSLSMHLKVFDNSWVCQNSHIIVNYIIYSVRDCPEKNETGVW